MDLVDSQSSYCSIDMLSGFPRIAIQEVLSLANSSISEVVLDSSNSILNKRFYKDIVEMVQEQLSLHPSSKNSSSESDSSASESSSKSSFDTDSECDHHCKETISSDSD